MEYLLTGRFLLYYKYAINNQVKYSEPEKATEKYL